MKWLPINEKYEISNEGDIRSLPREVRFCRNGIEHYRKITPKILKPWISGSGYKMVYLGRGNPVQVHVTVLTVFVGPRPKGCEAAHINGDKSDNRLINLGWVFRTENQHQRYLHGTRGLKLTQRDVQTACEMRAKGHSLQDVADALNISKQHAYRITSGQNLSEWFVDWRSPK